MAKLLAQQSRTSFQTLFCHSFSSCITLLSWKGEAWACGHCAELGGKRLPQGHCLTMGKSPHFFVIQFSAYKRGIIIVLGFTGVN